MKLGMAKKKPIQSGQDYRKKMTRITEKIQLEAVTAPELSSNKYLESESKTMNQDSNNLHSDSLS